MGGLANEKLPLTKEKCRLNTWLIGALLSLLVNNTYATTLPSEVDSKSGDDEEEARKELLAERLLTTREVDNNLIFQKIIDSIQVDFPVSGVLRLSLNRREIEKVMKRHNLLPVYLVIELGRGDEIIYRSNFLLSVENIPDAINIAPKGGIPRPEENGYVQFTINQKRESIIYQSNCLVWEKRRQTKKIASFRTRVYQSIIGVANDNGFVQIDNLGPLMRFDADKPFNQIIFRSSENNNTFIKVELIVNGENENPFIRVTQYFTAEGEENEQSSDNQDVGIPVEIGEKLVKGSSTEIAVGSTSPRELLDYKKEVEKFFASTNWFGNTDDEEIDF